MRCLHSMPYGAELTDDGVRFRLWAPAAKRVDLVLADRSLPMSAAAGGWHEITTDAAAAGSLYRYAIDGEIEVPDPASRFQPEDVHGPSEVIDGAAFDWPDAGWHGRSWEEAVLYELHVGTFSREGSYAGAQARLDYLLDLGVTAIELMPLADFPGRRGWGYDGVFAFAPESGYGRPEDLKALIAAAHQRRLMVLLDVVYNHFGPEGNYLHRYAPQFFSRRHKTPWGAAINFDGEDAGPVRAFFIANALYWLTEYRFDGLRLDAVHAIADQSSPDILEELAQAAREGPGGRRAVHLVLENDDNAARYLASDGAAAGFYRAQWNDDFHHGLHVLTTGEADGYYSDYAPAPGLHMARALAEGFAYQGEASRYRQGKLRGEPSRHLPPTAFVSFLQNHDQIGNRAFGERISMLAPAPALAAASSLLLLAPPPPLLFMGEEWAAGTPFPFFCDFGPELAAKVTEGRRAEFARFAAFADEAARSGIPDPQDEATFAAAKLDWDELSRPEHAGHLSRHRELLHLRRREIAPRLAGAMAGEYRLLGERAFTVTWKLGDASMLRVIANLDETDAVPAGGTGLLAAGRLLDETPAGAAAAARAGRLPPWSVIWQLVPGAGAQGIGQAQGIEPESGQGIAARGARGAAAIPRATYRLQFNRGFTFAQAAELVPYLAELGVSHIYASPYLRARPGSLHGYDIVDHNALNPEIGSAEDYERLTQTLASHGMGQILDIVPNHMGIMHADNAWWLDVLENGEASAYADHFDIEWWPAKEELRGKVLAPVLGDQYGDVLERGELKLAFDAAEGEFSIHYFQNRFPVDPREYPRILGRGWEVLPPGLAATPPFLELQSLATAFGHLPARDETGAEKIAERARDKEIHKRHLARLCSDSAAIAALIAANVRAINGDNGKADAGPERFDALHELVKAQAYRLAYWRVACDDINYRRFFDVNDLAALRMERAPVFEETHRLVLDLVAQGKLSGLRIDHADGLFDPGQYLAKLQARAGGSAAAGKPLYVVIEKIAQAYERLPDSWPIHGTAGYRFCNLVNGLFVDGAAEAKMDRIYSQFIGRRLDFDETLYRAKRLIMRVSLGSELAVLVRQLGRIALDDRHTCDFTATALREALMEVVACFPVYRTYITAAEVPDEARRFIDWAVSAAKKQSQATDLSIFEFLRGVLSTDIAAAKDEDYAAAVTSFAMKFQQFTGPVMAKGMEDTCFYRYNRLVCLNEVGGDPRRFGISPAAFHAAGADRAKSWPHTLLVSSSHDSKRSEDVRARIDVLSELPALWRLHLRRWRRFNRSKRRLSEGVAMPSRNDEYLLYQTLIGAWPDEELDAAALEAFAGRVEGYMLKVVREAKTHTSWLDPRPEYEEAVVSFVRALLSSPERNPFLADFLPFQREIARIAMYGSLSQTLLRMTAPGVPDIYQGQEIWDYSLVDPDNRRQVDFDRRLALLRQLKSAPPAESAARAAFARSLLDKLADGRPKLYVIAAALDLRRARAEAFLQGNYLPLAASGPLADHVIAYARDSEGELGGPLIAVAPRFFVRLLSEEAPQPLGAVWGDTALELPASLARRKYRNVLSGEPLAAVEQEGKLLMPLACLTANFPVALLAPP